MHKWLMFGLVVLQLLVPPIGCASKAITESVNPRKMDGDQTPPASSSKTDNDVLLAFFTLDQIDRQTNPTDWSAVSERDAERQLRVRELLDAGAVQTGADYYHAAMIFQHSDGVEGIELAHELAMIGAILGCSDARWLAAASYDRLLTRLGRGQRFGTQYISAGNGDPMHFAPVEPGVTDGMRAVLRCRALREGP